MFKPAIASILFVLFAGMFLAYGIPEITYVAPTLSNGSTTGFNWTNISIYSNESLNQSLLEWGNLSGFTNVSMLNGSLINWTVNMSGLIDGTYNYTIWAENVSGNWSQSARRYITVETTFHLVSCRNLTTNGSYVLMQNVSSAGTCFTISANNITLGGAGFWINYSQSALGYAVNNSNGNNNTVIKNLNIEQGAGGTASSYAIYAYGISGGQITNNTIKTLNVSGHGIVLSNSNSSTFIGNNITVSGAGAYGFWMNSSFSNAITGGSIISRSIADYFLAATDASNNFTNTNFTAARNITFFDSTSWFNYNNGTGSIWLKTNVSKPDNITRTLLNWSNSFMHWNDTNSTADVLANYNISGLIPGATYYINLTYGATPSRPYVSVASSSGNLPSFIIALNGSTEITVDGAPNITVVSPANGSYFNTNTTSLNLILNEAGLSCAVSLNGTANVTLSNTSLTAWGNSSFWLPTDGLTNVVFYCNDTRNNLGVSSIVYFTKDTIVPVIENISADTITSSSALIHWATTESSNYTITYGRGEGNYSLSLTGATFGSGSRSRTLDSLIASSTYFYKIQICDVAGNCNTPAANSFNTIAASQSSTDTGGSGGSGGSSSDLSKSWAVIASGSTATWTVGSASVDVTYVEITASAAATNAKLSVSKLSSKPSSVSSHPPGTLYQYLAFSADNLTDSKISSASITFRVNATWLSLNNLDPSTVKLYRYSGGSWNALPTSSAKGSTATYTNYVADTPGFSYFAISAEKKQVAVAQNSQTTVQNSSSNTTRSSNITSNATSSDNTTAAAGASVQYTTYSIAAVVILIAIIAGWMYYSKPKDAARTAAPASGGYNFKSPNKKTEDLVYKAPEEKKKVKYSYKPN